MPSILAIATLLVRQTRYLLLVKVPGKDSVRVVDALAAQVQTLPRQLRASLTWDHGVELAAHRRFSIATDLVVYICDPRSPWQRGTNEHCESVSGVARMGSFLSGLRDDLKARRFAPAPVREKTIPKASGKIHRLGIPTTADRVVQASLKLVLEPGSSPASPIPSSQSSSWRSSPSSSSLARRCCAALAMAGCIVAWDLVWYACLAYLVDRAGTLLRPRVRRGLEQSMGTVLVGLGTRLATLAR